MQSAVGLCTPNIAMVTSVGCTSASLSAGMHWYFLSCLENVNSYVLSQGLFLAPDTRFATEEGSSSIIIVPIVSKLIQLHFAPNTEIRVVITCPCTHNDKDTLYTCLIGSVFQNQQYVVLVSVIKLKILL